MTKTIKTTSIPKEGKRMGGQGCVSPGLHLQLMSSQSSSLYFLIKCLCQEHLSIYEKFYQPPDFCFGAQETC